MNKLPKHSIMTIYECHIIEVSERSNTTGYTQNTMLSTCEVEIHQGGSSQYKYGLPYTRATLVSSFVPFF